MIPDREKLITDVDEGWWDTWQKGWAKTGGRDYFAIALVGCGFLTNFVLAISGSGPLQWLFTGACGVALVFQFLRYFDRGLFQTMLDLNDELAHALQFELDRRAFDTGANQERLDELREAETPEEKLLSKLRQEIGNESFASANGKVECPSCGTAGMRGMPCSFCNNIIPMRGD